MKNLLILALLSVAIILPASNVFAVYKGPYSSNFIKADVATALKASDNTQMVLEGYIISHVRKDKYLFKDNTGTIIVELDKEDFFGVDVDENTHVRLCGEVDKGFSAVDFDVDYMKVIELTPKAILK